MTVAERQQRELDRYMRQSEVESVSGLSRTTIWRRERAGTFPRRRELGGGAVGWLESEVRDWIRSRPPVPLNEPSEAA